MSSPTAAGPAAAPGDRSIDLPAAAAVEEDGTAAGGGGRWVHVPN